MGHVYRPQHRLTLPDGRYPAYYGDSDKPVSQGLPDDCKGKGVRLAEFPILSTKQNYKGGEPGPDRVLLAQKQIFNGDTRITKYSRYFCLVMTHRAPARTNTFKVCPPDN